MGVGLWPAFDAQRAPDGALIVGNHDEVVEKVVRYDEALGGISRISFQMNAASRPHAKPMRAIEVVGTRVAPAVRASLAERPRASVRRTGS
jgi:hypothetical protein